MLREKDFSLDAFTDFDVKYHAKPSNPLRYGQAFVNTFGQILPVDVFYYENAGVVRHIILKELFGVSD